MTDPDTILDAVRRMRSRVLFDFRIDSCVIACKATQRLLRTMGVETRPLACSLLVTNALWRARARAGLQPLDDPAAYSVGIGKLYVTDRPVPVGHLILLAEGLLIDPSLDQANRPLMSAEPAVIALEAEQRATLLAGGTISYDHPHTGVAVAYTGHPGDNGYTTSPNWGNRDARLVERMVGDVIRSLREELAS